MHTLDPERIRVMRTIFLAKTGHLRDGGLLCSGGDLRPERLIAAYSLGIFPWYDDESPILWWSLNPRCILPLADFHISKRSARAIKNAHFSLTWDTAFSEVISACASTHGQKQGWLIPEMREAYCNLHSLGYAHSVETWLDGKLVGGLYGIGLEAAFFGESMFHLVAEASRAALVGLVALLKGRKCVLLDCQQETPHMLRMGACSVPLTTFHHLLGAAGLGPHTPHCRWKPWRETYDWLPESSSWSVKSK